jgi:hypothetical protein
MSTTRRLTTAALIALSLLAGSLTLSATVTLGAIGHKYETQIAGRSPSSPFGEPWGLAFNGEGDLYVADPGSAELGSAAVVDVFDPSNEPLEQFGSKAALGKPYSRDLAIGSTGTIYVADSSCDCIRVLNALGEEQTAWSGAHSPNESFGSGYVSVAVDNSTSPADPRKGDIYVQASQFGVVDVYKPAGEKEEGMFEGQLVLAEGFEFGQNVEMAVDGATGDVYVPNASAKVVDVFNAKGEAQPLLEPQGSEVPIVGSLGEPTAVGLDESAHEVYVVDRANKQVDEFSMQGKYLGSIRGTKSAGGLVPFARPRDVAVQQLAGATHGDVYVSVGSSYGEAHAVDVFGPDEEGPTVEAPVTEAVSGETASSAVLHGELSPPPAAKSKVAWYFEYNRGAGCTGGPTTPFEPEAEVQALKVSKEITGLEPDTQYTACVVAESNFGQNVGAPVPFTTSKVPPGVDEESVSNLTASSATIDAQINPYNQETFCVLEYGTDSTLATKEFASCGELPASLGDQPASASIEGLEADTTYYYRVFALNGSGEKGEGAIQPFKTVGSPLTTTGEADSVTRITAALSGAIDPERGATRYHFIYVDQATYERAVAEGAANPYAEGGATIDGEVAAGNSTVAAPPLLSVGLLPETTYHYALVATNNAGTATGGDATFTTGAGTPPIVTTGAASAITMSTATLAGTVDTRGLDVSYAFEVSTDPGNYGAPSGAGAIGAGPSEAIVQTTLQGLQPGTTYYYRLLATSTDGTSYGVGHSFTTQGFSSLLIQPATPPLIGTPNIAFPTDEGTVQTPPKTLTRAQKLTKALRACRSKHDKRKRARCEKSARNLYGASKARRAPRHISRKG